MATEKAKHTPGPWRWVAGFDKRPIDIETYKSPGHYDNAELCGPRGEAIITCDEYDVIGPTGTERGANARLISAAPDLLEAAWRAIELINKPRNEGVFEARNVLSAAIAKAEGR